MSRTRRWLWRTAAALAVGLPLIAAGLLLVQLYIIPGIVHRRIVAALSHAGLPSPRLNVEAVSPWRTHISNLTLGEAPTGGGERGMVIGSIAADYSPGSLSRGEIGWIDVVGLEYTLRLGPEGFDLGPLSRGSLAKDPGIPGPTSAHPRVKPADAGPPKIAGLRLHAATIIVDLFGRRVAIPLRGEAVRAGEDLRFDFTLDLPGQPVHVKGRWKTSTAQGPEDKPEPEIQATVEVGTLPIEVAIHLSEHPRLEFKASIEDRQATLAGATVESGSLLLHGEWPFTTDHGSAPTISLDFAGLRVNGAGPVSLDLEINGSPDDSWSASLRSSGPSWEVRQLMVHREAEAGAHKSTLVMDVAGRAPSWALAMLQNYGVNLSNPGLFNLKCEVAVQKLRSEDYVLRHPWKIDLTSLSVTMADEPNSSLSVAGVTFVRPSGTLEFQGNFSPNSELLEMESTSFLEVAKISRDGVVVTAAETGAGATTPSGSRLRLVFTPRGSRLPTDWRKANFSPVMHSRNLGDRWESRFMGIASIDQPVRVTGSGFVAKAEGAAIDLSIKHEPDRPFRASGQFWLDQAGFQSAAAQLMMSDVTVLIPFDWPAATRAAATAPAVVIPPVPPGTGHLHLGSLAYAGRQLGPVDARVRLDGSRLHAWVDAPLVEEGRLNAFAWADFADAGVPGQVRGELLADVAPFELKNPASLHALHPAAAELEVTGKVQASARIAYDRGQVTPRIELHLNDVTIDDAKADAHIRGLAADLAIDRFSPLSTPGGQRVALREGKVGKSEIRDAELLFRLESPGSVLVEKLSTGFIKPGRVLTTAFRFNPRRPEAQVTLFLQDVELQDWAEALSNGRVVGQGSVYGQLALMIDSQKRPPLRLGKGFLYSRSGRGWFQIKDPEVVKTALAGLDSDAPGKATDLGPLKAKAEQALKDFAYNALRIEFVEQDGEVVAQLRIAGKGHAGVDPLVFEGLNINIYDFNRFVNVTTRLMDQYAQFSQRVGRVLNAGLPTTQTSTTLPAATSPSVAPATAPTERAQP